MSDTTSSIPAWLQLFLATITGGAIAIAGLVRLGFSFNSRLQRIENQDLDKMIDTRISVDRHEHLYPMLQTRVFADLDKMEDELKKQGQNIAVLLERDRIGSSIERLITALNRPAKSD